MTVCVWCYAQKVRPARRETTLDVFDCNNRTGVLSPIVAELIQYLLSGTYYNSFCFKIRNCKPMGILYQHKMRIRIFHLVTLVLNLLYVPLKISFTMCKHSLQQSELEQAYFCTACHFTDIENSRATWYEATQGREVPK